MPANTVSIHPATSDTYYYDSPRTADYFDKIRAKVAGTGKTVRCGIVIKSRSGCNDNYINGACRIPDCKFDLAD